MKHPLPDFDKARQIHIPFWMHIAATCFCVWVAICAASWLLGV